MLEQLFAGIFDSSSSNAGINLPAFLACLVSALVIGALLAFAAGYKSRVTKSYIITMAVLPAVVCIVIMMVNGNIGAGIAVAGAFSLVRFRSMPGSAKEIAMLFLAMGAGMITGMGYIGYAFLFTIILCLITMLYSRFDFGAGKKEQLYRTIRVTIPENLNYSDLFRDLFDKYTESAELIKVKTTDMGSLFKLTYQIKLKDFKDEKTLIDEMRVRNGNLEIESSRQENAVQEF